MLSELPQIATSAEIAFRAETPELLDEQIAAYLGLRGYSVEKPMAWEAPMKLCARLGISYMTLKRRLADRHRPSVQMRFAQPELHGGKPGRGRLQAIASNAAFDKFCSAKRQ